MTADSPQGVDKKSPTDFEIISLEYAQVGENIRQSWQYVTTLIRQFILIQVLLISLVGLGGTAVTSATKIISGGDVTHQKAADAADRGNSDGRDKKEEKGDRLDKLLEFLQHGGTLFQQLAVGALMAIGLVFSLGAREQNRRLFYNAKEFVGRAASIENHLKMKALGKNKKYKSHFVYMYSRLDQGGRESEETKTGKAESTVNIVYMAGAIIWSIALVGYSIFLLIYYSAINL